MVCIPPDEASAWLKGDGSCEKGRQSRDPTVVATAGNKGVERVLWCCAYIVLVLVLI